MPDRRRVKMKALLADTDLRRELMVSTIQATQAREGIETTREQADRAYYVVTEAENAVFFGLERYRGGKRSEPDRREEIFCCALREEVDRVRFDVARRDFGTIDTSPLAYRRVGLVAHLFREARPLDPAVAVVKQGLATSEDPRWVRRHWEVWAHTIGAEREWAPFAKGGGFSRFYSDVYLVLQWADNGRKLKEYVVEKEGSESKRIYSQDWYFRAGLTWPRRTQRGFSIRALPQGCIFSDKGPSVFPQRAEDTGFLLGLMNSAPAEYLLQGLMSFGSWEVGVIKRLPIPEPALAQRKRIAELAQKLHDAKADWDTGNETSSRFTRPWLLRDTMVRLDVAGRLDKLAEEEEAEEAGIQDLYSQLNDEAYELYGISDATRLLFEETMGERPSEVLWPDMERKDADQKRIEHVWRLLSYAVRRVVEADDDGIVPFTAVGGESPLIERVRAELDALFPDHDLNQVEVGITNELRHRVKGYRRVETLEEWLRDEFCAYHASLYQKRPIFWHIASSQGRGEQAFGAIVHYHKFDHDRLAKLRGTYLRDAIGHFRREAGLANQEGRTADRLMWQGRVEEAEQLDKRLQWVQEGLSGHPAPGDCRIRTPWKSEEQQPKGWRPDLDDGVVVNIAPLQTAGVLRISS